MVQVGLNLPDSTVGVVCGLCVDGFLSATDVGVCVCYPGGSDVCLGCWDLLVAANPDLFVPCAHSEGDMGSGLLDDGWVRVDGWLMGWEDTGDGWVFEMMSDPSDVTLNQKIGVPSGCLVGGRGLMDGLW